ncbi:MAG TPA: M55 family metallopeptidase [Chthonomonas sp.]|uniref:M55 family metallopeptidase n=1 Tax=Chthonomonas sp. TaxID=2282153 RepID=UPI002B4B5C76|nr:M55 family metallopeptidase [Chthonomonas sp.]HLI47356.1 M55 family metallopeptidase [Chthonomonas sp.]
MRIYISVDLEGIGGVVRPEQVQPNHPSYTTTCLWATEEVLAAIKGARQAGATEFYVKDAHARGINLHWEALPAGVYLVAGRTRPTRFPKLHSTFHALFLIGYHAKAGTSPAVLAHTWEEGMRLWLNGQEIGEIAVDAAIAGLWGVPVTLVSGDDRTAEEARALLPCHTVVVKEATSEEGAILHPRTEVLQAIEEQSRRVVERLSKKRASFPPLQLSPPFHLRVEKTQESTGQVNVAEFYNYDLRALFQKALGEG